MPAVVFLDEADRFLSPATAEGALAHLTAPPTFTALETCVRPAVPLLKIANHESGFSTGGAVAPLDLDLFGPRDVDVDVAHG